MASSGLSRLCHRTISLSARHWTTRPSLGTRWMHFDVGVGLSADQAEYRQVAQLFAQEELAPYAAQWDERCFFPVETIRKAAALGFGSLYVRPDVGGTGLSRLEAALIFEALAVGDVSTSAYLTIHNMVAWMIDTFGSQEQRQQFLPQMITMEHFGSYCLTEPGSGSDAASLQTRAVKKNDEYILNGSKAFISGAGVSQIYIVLARTGGAGSKGISAIIVDKDAPGLSFGKLEKKLGWNSQPTRAVIFEDCRVPVKNLLGKEGGGFSIAMKGLDGGRINIGTTSLGGAICAYNIALDYVSVRKQFEQPLSSFQNTQFTLAELTTQLTAARLMVQHAARLLDTQHTTATMHCAMAKRFATDVGFQVTNSCMQLLGGYGYLQDYQVERILRDVRVHQILEGTNEIMKLITAKQILNAA